MKRTQPTPPPSKCAGCYNAGPDGCTHFAGDKMKTVITIGEGKTVEHLEQIRVLEYRYARRICSGRFKIGAPYRGEVALPGTIKEATEA